MVILQTFDSTQVLDSDFSGVLSHTIANVAHTFTIHKFRLCVRECNKSRVKLPLLPAVRVLHH